jgi:hypothetical protein
MVKVLLSYPHGNKMKGYGSCALFITISDFRGPPKQILPLLIILKNGN